MITESVDLFHQPMNTMCTGTGNYIRFPTKKLNIPEL